MVWDFVELNIFSEIGGSFAKSVEIVASSLSGLPVNVEPGEAFQQSAQALATESASNQFVISTDPPYYDNIGYSDLSEFFYVWIRYILRDSYPDLLATITTPKHEELVANPYRQIGKMEAEKFFLDGMAKALSGAAEISHPWAPITIYYAFKQSEIKKGEGAAITGWQIFLDALVKSGLKILGTWPLHTERKSRSIGQNVNALASSIVLVCERRSKDALSLSRSEFRRELRSALPEAIKRLESANIAPVDVRQAVIGPGMSIYSQCRSVLNADDSLMSTREALQEIQSVLDECLTKEDGLLDSDTKFALTFFESFGYDERPYGDAEGLALALNVSVEGVSKSGILNASAGKVQLLRRSQLPASWDPSGDARLCIWEATQYLIKRLDEGEAAASALINQLDAVRGHGDLATSCRALAYRLYNHCEKTKQAEEARAYNGLVIAWPELEKLAAVAASPVQPSLL